MSFYSMFGKRCLDLLVAITAIIILFPLMGLIALFVLVYLGKPVFFRQERIGKFGKPFMIYKFRTMTNAVDSDGNFLPESQRLVALGRFLRITSLDELPELFNVIKGDMSLVGPRPWLMRYYPYFTRQEQIRFHVRPGITGKAQVLGRNDLSWDARIQADVEYSREYSLWIDLRILFMTVWNVLKRRGLQINPVVVMVDFDEERLSSKKSEAS